MRQDLIIGIAGSGGDGVISAGESLISAAALEGYHAIMTKSFGSQIRGGEASCRLRLATQPVLNPNGPLDVAVALNWDDFLRFGSELSVEPATIVLYESETGIAPDKLPLAGVTPAVVFSVPISDMALRHAGKRIGPISPIVRDKERGNARGVGLEGKRHQIEHQAHMALEAVFAV